MPADPITRPPANPGFYGKLPARGDFVTRNLPRTFIDPWDEWLQAGLARSREQLENDWLDCYLTSPLWRFILSPDICGANAYAGVLMPSVDRVGRYFPLAIAAPLTADARPLALLRCIDDWFERAEQLILTGLEDDLDLDAFAAELPALGLPDQGPRRTANRHTPAADQAPGSGLHCRLSDDRSAPGAAHLEALTEHLLAERYPDSSLWWTQGSDRVLPCLTVCSRLPPVDGFAALLIGDWNRWGWDELVLGRADDGDGDDGIGLGIEPQAGSTGTAL